MTKKSPDFAGLHYWLVPLMLNELMTNRFSVIIPAMFVAFTARSGAALAAGLRSRQPVLRKLAFWRQERLYWPLRSLRSMPST
ncbi:hypothetical protein [Paenibacillus sp. TC-CSREp1]|uniref:hypothetical protein n=1 Tax=Paenibacillus sp. TC-CSREp1 TaxID=3410089 RepID=UPI003CF9CCEC